MSRPLFIILAVSFVVLLAITLFRLTDNPDGDDGRSAPITRGPHVDRGQPRAPEQRAEASGESSAKGRIPLSVGAVARNPIEPRRREDTRDDQHGEGGSVAREHSSEGTTSTTTSYNGGSRRDVGGEREPPGGNPLGAAPRAERNTAAGEDARFHAAAEQIADAGRQAPPAEHGEESASEDLVHEPPAKPVVDDSMTYNSGDYRFSLDSPFQIPHTGDAGTVALWMQPEWSPDDQQDAAVMELGDGKFQVYKNVNILRFEVDTDSPEHSTSYSIAGWQPGEWHAVTASWGDGQVTFYVDGQPVGKPIRATFKQEGETPVTIGTMPSAEQTVAPATVSDVSLRNRGLSADEIAKLYNQSALAPRPQ